MLITYFLLCCASLITCVQEVHCMYPQGGSCSAVFATYEIYGVCLSQLGIYAANMSKHMLPCDTHELWQIYNIYSSLRKYVQKPSLHDVQDPVPFHLFSLLSTLHPAMAPLRLLVLYSFKHRLHVHCVSCHMSMCFYRCS